MRWFPCLLIIAACGPVEAPRPRTLLTCPDCLVGGEPDRTYAVGQRLVVDASWFGICRNPRIGVEGRSPDDDLEPCEDQIFQADVGCAGVHCDVERLPEKPNSFAITPREPGALDIAITFVPQPHGRRRTLQEKVAIVRPDRVAIECAPHGVADAIAPENSFRVWAYLASGTRAVQSTAIQLATLEPEQACDAFGATGRPAALHAFSCDRHPGDIRLHAQVGDYASTATVRADGSRCVVVP